MIAVGVSLLHASECWPLRTEVQRLLHNKRAKIKVEDVKDKS